MFFGPVESTFAVGRGGRRPPALARAQTPLGAVGILVVIRLQGVCPVWLSGPLSRRIPCRKF